MKTTIRPTWHSIVSAILLSVAGCLPGVGRAEAADCNGNGVDDDLDLLPGDLRFELPIYYVGDDPKLLAATDLDGDGAPDLATANHGTNDVSVLINRGDGTFGVAHNFPLGDEPTNTFSALISVDLDLDGRQDLVTASPASSKVSVLTNRGGGVLAPPVDHVVGTSPFALIAADLNDDGFPDLATANNGANSVSVCLSRGNGTFKPAVSYPTAGTPFSLVPADFDGDGRTDLATASTGPKNLCVFLNQGGGAFMAAVCYPVPSASPSSPIPSLISADFDGDGRPDLAAVECDPDEATILLNRGDGTFHDPVGYGIEADSDASVRYVVPLIAGDFDGDGTVDLATTSRTKSSLSILFNQGSGAFEDALRVSLPLGQSSLIAADLNADGKLDMATEGGLVLINPGDGRFQRTDFYGPLGAGPALIAADLDGDGRTDLAASGGSFFDPPSGYRGMVRVVRNRGDGSFTRLRYGGGGTHSVLADLNGDGWPEIAGVQTRGGFDPPTYLSISLNRGDGTFEGTGTELAIKGSPRSLGAVDVDGDGDVDLATSFARSGSDKVAILRNRGDGSFAEIEAYPLGGPPLSGAMIAADFDGDGKPDLSTAMESGGISVHMNAGDGTLRGEASYPTEGFPVSQLAADLSGDGKLDLAIAISSRPGPGHVAIMKNAGDGSFLDGGSYAVGGAPTSMALGDFDGDGSRQDLATSWHGLPAPSGVSLLIRRGDGTFEDARSVPLGVSFALIAADVDVDGKEDLASMGPDGLSVLIQRGGGIFDDAVSYPNPHQLSQVTYDLAMADLDGDAKPDFIASGPAVFLNEGDGTFQSPILYPGVGGRVIAADISGDSLADLVEVAYAPNLTTPMVNGTLSPASRDVDGNGVPDECEARFHRGDSNSSGDIDLSDAIAIFGFLFLSDARPLSCLESADANNDADVDISDGIFLLNWLFVGGDDPPSPGPTGMPCGLDTDPMGSAGFLGCAVYPACE